MRLSICVGVALLVGVQAASAEPTETRIGADTGIAFGVFGATHSLLSVSLERTFGGRLHLAGRVGFGAWTNLVTTEETAELGVVLHPSQTVSLTVGWRAGHAYFRRSFGLFSPTVDANLFVFEPVLRIGIRRSGKWELRFVPLSPTGYRSRVWGFTAGTEIGLARRF